MGGPHYGVYVIATNRVHYGRKYQNHSIRRLLHNMIFAALENKKEKIS